MSEIHQLVSDFKAAKSELENAVALRFPWGFVVNVIASAYNGQGIVRGRDDCPSHLLPVELENENIWWYPVEGITRLNNFRTWDRWIRRRLKTEKIRAITQANLRLIK